MCASMWGCDWGRWAGFDDLQPVCLTQCSQMTSIVNFESFRSLNLTASEWAALVSSTCWIILGLFEEATKRDQFRLGLNSGHLYILDFGDIDHVFHGALRAFYSWGVFFLYGMYIMQSLLLDCSIKGPLLKENIWWTKLTWVHSVVLCFKVYLDFVSRETLGICVVVAAFIYSFL